MLAHDHSHRVPGITLPPGDAKRFHCMLCSQGCEEDGLDMGGGNVAMQMVMCLFRELLLEMCARSIKPLNSCQVN